jgi:hypothetical protein
MVKHIFSTSQKSLNTPNDSNKKSNQRGEKMVNEELSIKNKWKGPKKTIKRMVIIFSIALILLLAFGAGYMLKELKPSENTNNMNSAQTVIENPLKNIVFSNMNNNTGEVNKEKVMKQATQEFNADYINYILAALGISYLHKSPLGENPKIKFVLEEDIWSSEITNGKSQTVKKEINDEDLRISLSKEEAVESMLSKDIEAFMKNSVAKKRTNIEMVAGKTELFTKGYLDMYNHLSRK